MKISLTQTETVTHRREICHRLEIETSVSFAALMRWVWKTLKGPFT
jgi:hypothetical protein